MNTKNKEEHIKSSECNCDSCKELRSLDKIDRVSRWVLGTVKWIYDYGYVVGVGACDSNRAYPYDKFKKLEKEEQKYIISSCETAYKPFKKYLLFYICYLFGAYFQQCKRNKIKFKFERDFLMIQLKSFIKMIEKFYKNPNKKTTVWFTLFDNLFEKKDLDINKNFFLALSAPLKENQLNLIVDWFIDNKDEKVVKNIFYSAAHYFHMELDEKSSFLKIKESGNFLDALSFKLSEKDFKGFDKSKLPTTHPLRYSFVYLALDTQQELNNLFINYKHTDDFIKKIITIGPNISFGYEPYKK